MLRDAIVPALTVVALPKAVTGKDSAACGDTATTGTAAEGGKRPRLVHRLTAAEKEALMQSRGKWCLARKQIHTDDLPWLLAVWLPEGSLGVPADAQSGSQDFFLRLHGGVLGFALKAAGESSPTGWSAVRDELNKAPVLSDGLTYTLVLWSLNLAPEVRDAVGTAADKARFEAGAWCLSNGKLVRVPTVDGQAAPPKPEFVVPSGCELIVVNPHAPSGGGLHELLGSSVLGTLRDMSRAKGGLSVALLADWTAPTGHGAPAAPASV